MTGYYLHMGTSVGADDLVNIGPLSGTSATVTLPTNGATIYVRLWTSFINGAYPFSPIAIPTLRLPSAPAIPPCLVPRVAPARACATIPISLGTNDSI